MPSINKNAIKGYLCGFGRQTINKLTEFCPGKSCALCFLTCLVTQGFKYKKDKTCVCRGVGGGGGSGGLGGGYSHFCLLHRLTSDLDF